MAVGPKRDKASEPFMYGDIRVFQKGAFLDRYNEMEYGDACAEDLCQRHICRVIQPNISVVPSTVAWADICKCKTRDFTNQPRPSRR